MPKIIKYEKQDGSVAYKMSVYLGIDPVTKKKSRTTLRASTQKELKLKLAHLQVEISKKNSQSEIDNHLSNSSINQNITFNEIYILWLAQYENTVKESTYVKTVELFNNHIIPIFGEYRLTEINVTLCQQAINKWFLTLKRYSIIMNYVARVLGYGITLRIITDNPAKMITKPIKKNDFIEEQVKNYYTREELNKFLYSLSIDGNTPHHIMKYNFFRLLAYTGMRKGEAFALNWSDINLDDNTIKINKTMSRGKNNKLIIQSPKTKKSVRKISIDDNTISHLKHWRKIQKEKFISYGINTNNPNQLIFSNEENELLQPTKSRKWLIAIQEKYQLEKITTHGLRHTHCSLLFESSTPEEPITIQDVQERLGHSDIQTTMNIYNHVTEKAKEKTALTFAKYMM